MDRFLGGQPGFFNSDPATRFARNTFPGKEKSQFHSATSHWSTARLFPDPLFPATRPGLLQEPQSTLYQQLFNSSAHNWTTRPAVANTAVIAVAATLSSRDVKQSPGYLLEAAAVPSLKFLTFRDWWIDPVPP